MKQKLEKQFGLRMPQSLWLEIQRLAEAELITPSIFIRRAVVREIERQTKQGQRGEHERTS